MSNKPSDDAPSVRTSSSEIAEIEKGGLPVAREMARVERRTLAFCALCAAIVLVWVAEPFLVGILFGALTGFLLEPLHRRLIPRVGAKGAALSTVVVASLGLAATTFGLGWLIVARGTILTRNILQEIGPGGAFTRLVNVLAARMRWLNVSAEDVTAKLREIGENVAGEGAALAAAVLAGTASAALMLFFATLTMYAILLHWKDISLAAQEALPLRPDYTRALFNEFRKVGRTTLLGTIVTGLVQGVLATAGYVICGVPAPWFWGAVTALASLVPAVGTLLVWVPAGVLLIVGGDTLRGVLELIWGAVVVVGVCDYVIRPKLVGGEGKMPSLVTFVALFGGVESFGLKGLVVGPIVVSLAIAVLTMYRREASIRRAASLKRQ